MRILHLINSTRMGGGAQEMLAKLVRFGGSELENRVVSILSQGKLEESVRANHCLGVDSATKLLSAAPRLRRIIRKEAPDAIVSWMYHSCMLAASIAPRGPRQVWNIRHSIDDIAKEKRSTRLAVRACAMLSRIPDMTIYCAESSISQHTTLGFKDRQSITIPNGFDTRLFKPLHAQAKKTWKRQNGIPDDAFLIGNAARYHPMKNHKGLLESFAAVVSEKQNVHLALAGRNILSDNEKLTAEVAKLGLMNRVTLCGLQADMPKFLGALDLYVSSSLWGEGFPNVIGEAMSCGTPVLTTDVGDSARIVGDVGFVAARAASWRSGKDLDLAIRATQQNECLLRHRSRLRIINEFTIERTVDDYARAIKKVL